MFLCCRKRQIANKSLSNFSTRCLRTDVSATPLLALGPSHGRPRWGSSSSSSNNNNNSSSSSIWRASPTSALDSSAKTTTMTGICPLRRRHRLRSSSSHNNRGHRRLCSRSSSDSSSSNSFRVRCSSSPQLQLCRHECFDVFNFIFFPNYFFKAKIKLYIIYFFRLNIPKNYETLLRLRGKRKRRKRMGNRTCFGTASILRRRRSSSNNNSNNNNSPYSGSSSKCDFSNHSIPRATGHRQRNNSSSRIGRGRHGSNNSHSSLPRTITSGNCSNNRQGCSSSRGTC